MTRIWVPCIVSAAAGLTAGWLLHPTISEAPTAGQVVEQHMALGAGLPVPAAAIDVQAMRAMFREELASAVATITHAVPVAMPVPKPLSSEQVAQQTEAAATVDGLISGGVWGEEQRVTFRQEFPMLSSEKRQQALQQLMTGINSGAIHVTVEGSPL